MKLTQREKQLLWCFINVGVLLFGVKWVFPTIHDAHQKALEKLQTNETYALEAGILLAREEELQEGLEQYKKELTEEASYYFSKLDPEYTEAWIMGISNQYPIKIGTLNIEAVHSVEEEGAVEVLPISMSLEGDEQTFIDFINALLNDNRHVVIESVQLGEASAQVRMALYRIDKTSDLLENTVFNQAPGKGFLMKPFEEESIIPEIETEVEPEEEPVPEENHSNLSVLEDLLGQLLRPQENGNNTGQPPTNGENQEAESQEQGSNKPEIEGDKNEDAAQGSTEGAQAETTPSSNS